MAALETSFLTNSPEMSVPYVWLVLMGVRASENYNSSNWISASICSASIASMSTLRELATSALSAEKSSGRSPEMLILSRASRKYITERQSGFALESNECLITDLSSLREGQMIR